jgi:hypothetical protein
VSERRNIPADSGHAIAPQKLATTETGTASNVKNHPRPSQRDNGISATNPKHKPGARNFMSGSIVKNRYITQADKLAEMNPKMPNAKLNRSARMCDRGSSSQRGGPCSNNQFIGFLVEPLT